MYRDILSSKNYTNTPNNLNNNILHNTNPDLTHKLAAGRILHTYFVLHHDSCCITYTNNSTLGEAAASLAAFTAPRRLAFLSVHLEL